MAEILPHDSDARPSHSGPSFKGGEPYQPRVSNELSLSLSVTSNQLRLHLGTRPKLLEGSQRKPYGQLS